ncbi:MAG TPA: family 43 glycosylhydrolase, partial [Prolixibacteraceae bacterium]|nr:family 43 glycosylhydrolase [Prolixibacteraceae bacterium]
MRFYTIMLAALMLSGCQNRTKSEPTPLATVCNPVNISYRFCIDEPSRREAADPSVVWFNGRYFLFASKSGGYWHSKDLGSWEFIETEQIPAEEYAPTVVAIGEELYFLASSNEKSTIYKTSDPLSGQWVVAVEELETPVWDPMFFFENDKLYLYWGCSNTNPLYGVEVDYRNNFKFLGKPVELLKSNTAQNGWEVPGDYNTMTHQSPWIEGAWVNKINGKYYLQYAGPGTEFKSYSDGVYTSDNPLGPFSLQQHNPFAYRPEGFIAGAGHGSTFSDQYGNLWHIGTLTISQKHMFERRLGIFPVFVSNDGILYTTTRYGDYPYFIPQKKISSYEDISTGWMLLSYRKPVEVSSAIDSLPAVNITDENIRTYWAASGTNSGEYVIIDLQNPSEVKALQVNFAEHNTNIFGRKKGIKYRYVIDCSDDKMTWKVLTDRSNNETDNSH